MPRHFFTKSFIVLLFCCLTSPLWAQTAVPAKVPAKAPAPKKLPFEPHMVTIPSGQFFMGEQSDESDKYELPVHPVSVRSFKLGKTEITVGQYRQFVLDTGYVGGSSCWHVSGGDQPMNWMSPNVALSDYHPVVCVNWDDAKAYVQWLAKKTGKKYRLPTEAEWEYAARAGTATKYYFGNDASSICSYGNVSDAAGKGTYGFVKYANCDDGADFTTVVGSYMPNAFGLYDMVGNVFEWTEDCNHETYDGAPSNGSAWVTGECKVRVLRGGSWLLNPSWARSAHRLRDVPALRATYSGFRIAQD